MANLSGISWGAEVYRAVIFELNQLTGAILAPGTPAATPYEGFQLLYPRVYTLDIATPRIIANLGQGRVTDSMYFPPTDPDRGTLTIGHEQHDVIEALTGVKQWWEGERSVMLRATDKRGSEKVVAMLLEQKARDENGLPRWRYYIIPRATAVPNDSSYNAEATEITYNIAMSACKTTLWGLPLSIATHGCLEAGYASGMSVGMYNIVAWLADGYEDVFNFPADRLPNNATKVKIYDFNDGSVVAGTVAGDFSTFTPTTPPDDGDLLIASYETD